MAKHLWVLAASVAMVSAGPALAGEGDAAENQGRRGGRNPERMQKILEQFDADGDGRLSQTERQAARAAREQRMGERGGRGEAGRRGPGGRGGMMDPSALFDRIDTDGDGAITKDQFVQFMQQMRAQMGQRGGQGRAAGRVGGRRGAGQGRGRPPAESPNEIN
ncbi:MAG: EF-hand domain-containing protein [Planctomycetota bacterium]